MDNKNLEPVLSDFTEEEANSLKDWELNNRPGIHSVNSDKSFEWFRLYMSGKTYSEIAKATNSKRDLVLFASRSQKWFAKKTKYYADISDNMIKKYTEAKLSSLDTLSTAVSAMNGFFGAKFTEYIKTNNEDIIKSIDSKMLAQYHKINESMDKIVADITGGESSGNSGTKQPILNINMSGSATVTKVDENTVKIDKDDSIKEQEVKEILSQLSKIKKAREEG